MVLIPRSYPILKEGKDFFELPESVDRGTRAKKFVIDKNGRKAIFKFDGGKFRGSEDCSEKIASELAKAMSYNTADISLAEGSLGERGLLSYLFINPEKDEVHDDMESFLQISRENEAKEYTISNIRRLVEERFSEVDFNDFIHIVFFDAFVGERDRHAGNWGITTKNGHQSISPLYDTASCLLRDFANDKMIHRYTTNGKTLADYTAKNTLALYKDDGSGQYMPSESVVDYLLENYPETTIQEIHKLNALKSDIIKSIVKRIPASRMSDAQKTLIIEYLLTQKEKIIKKEKTI